LAALVVVVAVVVEIVPLPETPTQYAWSNQKLVVQSLLTAGFQAKNWLNEIPLLVASEPQVSPDSTTSHLLQSAGWPSCVGAGGVGLEALVVVVVVVPPPSPEMPTQYAWSSQKLVVQSVLTAGFQA
jgi:hypothetical protein